MSEVLTAHGRNPRNRADNATKTAIADAAEELFGLNGLHGTTIRDVFKRAQISPGLMSYYFPSKDELYEYVIIRKLENFRGFWNDEFECSGNSPQELFRTYINFFFHETYDSEILRPYVRLLARASVEYHDPQVAAALRKFDFIANDMAAALSNALPNQALQSIKRAILFLEAATTTILISDGLVDYRLSGRSPLPDLVDDFCAFAMRGLSST